jgi:hypothetical protein
MSEFDIPPWLDVSQYEEMEKQGLLPLHFRWIRRPDAPTGDRPNEEMEKTHRLRLRQQELMSRLQSMIDSLGWWQRLWIPKTWLNELRQLINDHRIE